MKAQADGKFIDPLTGLRFIAAATVAIGHAAPSLRDDWLGHLVAQVSSVGMTLFFVLSGFVLWLTYSERMLRSPRVALRDFAVARFARLYPMYALVTLVITGYLVIWRNQDPTSLVFVLTMTQAWFPAIKGTMLVAAIQPLEHLWSISVELFFYLLFPLACFAFGRIERVQRSAWLALLNVAVFAITIALAFPYGDTLLRAAVPSLRHDGMAWLTYYSPYLHVSQFLAGCLTAQIYLKLASAEVDASICTRMRSGFWISAAGLLAAPVLLFVQPSLPAMSFWIELGVRIDEVICFSVLILTIARFGSAQFLGSKAMVLGGECSYSIYLLHPFLFRFAIIGKSEFANSPEFVMRLVLFIAITTAVAWVFYTVVEVPSKAWLRRRFQNDRQREIVPSQAEILSLE
jgi:peptidoglycan/LPS O-acetylase OafA/YrhL